MKNEKLIQQKKEAMANTLKNVSELKENDFICLYGSGIKFCRSVIQSIFDCLAINESKTFCIIEKIVHCSEDDFNNGNFVGFGRGGSYSEVFDDETDFSKLSKEDFNYFFDVVTLFICDNGKFVFIDAEGFDYPRYMLFSLDYKTVFAHEIEEHKKELEQIRQEEIEEHKKRYNQQIEENKKLLDCCNPLKDCKWNIKQILKKYFQNFEIKVSFREDRRHLGKTIYLTIDNTDEEKKFIKEWIMFLNKFKVRTIDNSRFSEYDSYVGYCIVNTFRNYVGDYYDICIN